MRYISPKIICFNHLFKTIYQSKLQNYANLRLYNILTNVTAKSKIASVHGVNSTQFFFDDSMKLLPIQYKKMCTPQPFKYLCFIAEYSKNIRTR